MTRRWLGLVLAIVALCACTRIVVLSPPSSDAGKDAPRFLPDAVSPPDASIDSAVFDAGVAID